MKILTNKDFEIISLEFNRLCKKKLNSLEDFFNFVKKLEIEIKKNKIDKNLILSKTLLKGLENNKIYYIFDVDYKYFFNKLISKNEKEDNSTDNKDIDFNLEEEKEIFEIKDFKSNDEEYEEIEVEINSIIEDFNKFFWEKDI